MKKKLISLFLGIIMVLSVALTGCGSSDKTTVEADVEESERNPITLSLWLPTKKGTTDEALKLVQEQINLLTQSKYKTSIELHAIDEDKYADSVDSRINEIENNIEAAEKAERDAKIKRVNDAIDGVINEEYAAAETEIDEDESQAAETVVNENGVSKDVYPEVSDQQLDIFLIKGYDTYKKYIDEEMLTELTADISSAGSKLGSYIYPSFFDLQKYDDGVYCVPNNHAIGKYQLLLVNKELVEQYDYNPVELTTLSDCVDFINDIGEQNLAGVTPLLGECGVANVRYWSSDGKPSLIGNVITPDIIGGTLEDLMPTTLSQMGDVLSTMLLMKQFKSKGYVGDGNPEGKKFAVGVLEGDASIYEQYGDEYYISIHGVPVAEREDVFESVFAVSKFTADSTRAMEIISYLNTDQNLRTLLQYGVEGVHWEKTTVDGEEVIHRLNNDYMMNIIDTGNVFMTYPDENKPISDWDIYKQQNLDSVASPYCGFEFVTDENKNALTTLARRSAEYFEKIEAMSYEEFKAAKGSMSTEIIKNSTVQMLLNPDGTDDLDDTIAALYSMYYEQYK